MKTNKDAFLNLGAMLCLTLGLQLIQVLKSSRIAALFGTGMEMDAYNLLNSVAGFIFNILGTGIGTILVPALVKKNASMRSCNGFLTLLYGLILMIMGILLVFRRPLLTIVSGNTGEFIDLAASLMIWVLLAQLATSISAALTSVLNCRNSYVLPKVLAMTVTLCITGYIYLAPELSIGRYAFLSFALIMGELIVQAVVAGKKGFHYRPCLSWKDPGLREMIRTFIPTVWGSGVFQLSLLADSVISSTLGAGNISILGYANSISTMLNTSLAGNILAYIYPKIAVEANSDKGKRKLFQYMVLFAMVMFVVVVLFVAAGHDAVRILFQRGKFTATDTNGVFLCVLIYLVGSPANVMRDLVYRYFYSKGNTKSTSQNGMSACILNVVISILLARLLGLYGVVLGTTVTAVFSFTSILIRMKKQYTFGGNFPFFAREMSKVAGATVLAICGCMLIKAISLPWPSLAVSVLAAVASVLVFGVVLLAARSKVLQVELG